MAEMAAMSAALMPTIHRRTRTKETSMSEKAKVKCAACERRREELKNQSIRIWRKAQSVIKKVKR